MNSLVLHWVKEEYMKSSNAKKVGRAVFLAHGNSKEK